MGELMCGELDILGQEESWAYVELLEDAYRA